MTTVDRTVIACCLAALSRRSCQTATLLATASMLAMSYGSALANEQDGTTPGVKPSNELLLKKLEAMERRVKLLEGQLKQKQAAASISAPQSANDSRSATQPANASRATASADPAAQQKLSGARAALSTADQPPPSGGKAILGVLDSPLPGLAIGAYGELKFGSMQNAAAGGQWQNGFDAHRFVLLPTYALTPNIIFNAEIEFEHAGSGFDNDDKLHGTAEVEQLWVDFKIVDQFNWRAPGIDLVPFGYINQHHEPTQFYSVNRPELYNGLIPSTWKVPSTSVYGTLIEGLKYQIMVSSGQEDFGDSFDNRTAAKTVPAFPTAYAPGIDGRTALGFSRPPLGDFQQLTNSLAVSGKLDFSPSFMPGFAGSVSGYFTPNTTPRGAHDDMGNPLGNSSLTMFDAEFRYRVPNTGLEVRGEYVQAMFGNPANLRANNDSDPTNNVGKTMYGYSGEVAYHVPLGTILNSEWEAVPFYRYTMQNLQTGGFAGTDLDMPTGAGQTQYHSVGIALFPSPKLALKATYQKVKNNDPVGANSDSVLGGVGFFF